MYPGKRGLLIPASIVGFFMLSPLPLPSLLLKLVQLVNVDAAVVGRGVRASKLIGSTVKIDRSERIGSIEDIIIDERGQLFVVLDVGGFLGLGGRRVALPYSNLKSKFHLRHCHNSGRQQGATREGPLIRIQEIDKDLPVRDHATPLSPAIPKRGRAAGTHISPLSIEERSPFPSDLKLILPPQRGSD